MKDVMKWFIGLVLVLWLIIGHVVAIYFSTKNPTISIWLGIVLIHIDVFIFSAFFVGYEKYHDDYEEESE